MLKTIRILPLLLCLFIFSGCFNIIHFLALNTDGTISVNWRFTISQALQKNNKANKKSESLKERFEKAQAKLDDKLKGKISNFVLEEIDTKHEAGIIMKMKIKDGIRLQDQDAFPVIPFFDKAQKQLTFAFRPGKKGQGGLNIPRSNKKPVNEADPKKSDTGSSDQKKKPVENESSDPADKMNQMMKMVMSSARYQIILGGEFLPSQAWVMTRSTKTKIPINIVKLGSQYYIDFPFISLHFEDDQGYDLLVQMK